nr:MAG TPA: major capsid protein [Caudoviricetes sp.]
MPKEKSVTELKDERNQLSIRAKVITDSARAEKRRLKEEEDTELGEIQCRMVDINTEIVAKEAENSQRGERHQVQGQSFSLRKVMLEMVDGTGYSDEVRQMNDIGRNSLEQAGVSVRGSRGIYIPVECRDSFTATGTTGTGSDLVETNFMDIQKPLRDRLVLSQAGARVLTGLRGNIDIPDYSGSTANWEGENNKANDGGGKFSHKTMKPKRLTSILTVSRQLLIQDSLGVEQLLRSDLIDAIAGKLEATILGNHNHTDTIPDGLFTGFSGDASAMNWAGVVDLETQVDLANALDGNTGYIMHTVLRGKGKTTVKAAQGALGFLIDPDGTMNGYKVLRTNSVATNATTGENPTAATAWGITFANWAELLIGQWGAIDLMVDPYTKADEAFVRIIVNSYWDANMRRSAAIAKSMMK